VKQANVMTMTANRMISHALRRRSITGLSAFEKPP
jgi:hypothetical protein